MRQIPFHLLCTGAFDLMSIPVIQDAIQAAGLDGWLFYDFRGSDPLAYSILGLPADAFRSRRWFYFVPARGEPTRIVHAIETGALDALPGAKKIYLPWQQLHQLLRETLAGHPRIAMQYSPNNNIPYVAKVDAGTIELIRSFGVEIATSADLVSQFEATLTAEQLNSHQRAANELGHIVQAAFAEVGRRLRAGQPTTEFDIQQWIVARFAEAGLGAAHDPIVAADAHSADPHYEPTATAASPLRAGQWLLIDAWCKENRPGSIYADITWTGWLGREVPAEQLRIFEIVRDARDAAVRHVQTELSQGHTVRGCDVDDACRAVIQAAGFGDFFIHRTGHSLHTAVHANGANIDNLESRDERKLLPRTMFTVEPGIYLPGRFGVRSELNVFVADATTAYVTGVPAQRDPICVEC